MAEDYSINHPSGAMGQPSFLIQNTTPGVTFGGTGRFIDLYIRRVDKTIADPAGSGVAIHATAAITGSTSGQTVPVTTSSLMTTTPFDWWIIDPGTTSQEIVGVYAIPDLTHFTTLCRKNHLSGAPMRKVYSVWSNFIQQVVNNCPTPNGIGNMGFIQRDPLPPNIYAQYQISGSVGTYTYVPDDVVPWYSAASTVYDYVPLYDPALVTATGNPSNGIILDAGPQGTTGGNYVITPCPIIQIISTQTPELAMLEFPFRIYYDDL